MVQIQKPKTIIPNICPRCESKLHYVNALDECGLYMVFCTNPKCRFCKNWKLEEL